MKKYLLFITIIMIVTVFSCNAILSCCTCRGKAIHLAGKLSDFRDQPPRYIDNTNVSYRQRVVPKYLSDHISTCRESDGYLIFYIQCDIYGGNHVLCTPIAHDTNVLDCLAFFGAKVFRYEVLDNDFVYIILK